MSITRGELRNVCADILNDRIELIATGGSTTTFVDAIELVQFDDTLIGAQLVIETGANAGQVVTVTGNTGSTGTLTFAALGNAIVAGVEASLLNLRGAGWTKRQYDSAIANACNSRDLKNLVETTEDGGTFDAEDPVIDVPASLLTVYGVQALLTTSWDYPTAVNLRAARYKDAAGWWVDTATRELTINGRERNLCHEATITIFGREAHPVPTTDASTIRLDQEWLTYTVLANLTTRRGGTNDRWAVEFLEKAAAREAFIVPALHANEIYIGESSS